MRAKVKGLTWSATDAVNNSNDPVFGQTLYMLVDDPNERSLTVQVQDADDAEQGGFGNHSLTSRRPKCL